MNLTPQNLQAIKAEVAADQVLGQLPQTPDNAFAIAAALNLAASPEFVVWKKSVSVAEIMLNGFDWTRVDNLTVGKSRIWEWMTQFGTINPTKDNIRAGIDATWVGTAADLAVRAAVYVHCKRNAKRWEKLIATGTGSDASPAVIPDGFTDTDMLQYTDILNAWAS